MYTGEREKARDVVEIFTFRGEYRKESRMIFLGVPLINWFRADRQFHISNSILALSAHNFNLLHVRARVCRRIFIQLFTIGIYISDILFSDFPTRSIYSINIFLSAFTGDDESSLLRLRNL